MSETNETNAQRSEKGLRKRYDPKKYADIDNFKQEPQYFWRMYEEIHNLKVQPSQIHKALTELQRMGIVKTIITQNVDGIHQMAGSKNVLEMHGSGKVCYCLDCHYIALAEEEIWKKTKNHPSLHIPHCPKCGGLLKLDIVMFGEKLNKEIYDEALKASSNTDFLLVVGTSLQVAPCNIIPFRARHNGAEVAFINCSKTPMDQYADFLVRSDAQNVIPKIVDRVKKIVCLLQNMLLYTYITYREKKIILLSKEYYEFHFLICVFLQL